MIGKMPGDDWQKFANLRLLYGYMFGHPGKKLLFMGSEFGQWREWNHDQGLDWNLLDYPFHSGLRRWIRDCNTFYRGSRVLYEAEHNAMTFEWIDCNDNRLSTISFLRRSPRLEEVAVFVCNFTPLPQHNYRVGVPNSGYWQERLNSDAVMYGGSGMGNIGGVSASPTPIHGRPFSLNITLPPLGCVVFLPGESQP
jgi:1,4-alpha-glucan branching enzyme